MRNRKLFAVLIATAFAAALASPVLVADAAGPIRDYDKARGPVSPAPVNPNVKGFVDNQKSPNQQAKPAQPQPIDQIGSKLPPKPPAGPPQVGKPVAPSAKPAIPPQVRAQGTQKPSPTGEQKNNAAFVGKVNNDRGPAQPAKTRPSVAHEQTLKDLGVK